MKIQSEQLIGELIKLTAGHIEFAESLQDKTDEELNRRNSNDSWSVLECLEHLNLYGNFYLPEIEKRIKQSTSKFEEVFKSGYFGNYFAQSMLPKEKLNKMKTFKKMNPIHSRLDKRVIEMFINQQLKTIELLEKSQAISLNKVKTGISITSLIKFKLGDTFRFMIYHNKRHIVQAKNVIRLTN